MSENRDLCGPCERSVDVLVEVPPTPAGFWDTPEVQAALEARHFGRLLRAYRHLHEPAIQQAVIANLLGLTQGQVSRIERSANPVTDLAKLERWCRLLNVPQEHLWFTLSAQSSDAYAVSTSTPKLAAVHAITGEDVQRRQFLRSASAGAATVGLTLLGGTTAVAASGAIGMSDVEEVRQTTEAFRATDNQFGGGQARTALNIYLDNTVEPMLNTTRIVDTTKRALFRAVVELRQLAGWVAYDVGHVDEGRDHLREALRMAQEIGDEALCGEMLAAMSHHAAFQGSGDAAVDLALASQHSGRRSGLAALEAEGAVMEAHGLAMQNDRRGCLSAMHRAERAFGQIDAAKTPAWLTYFDSSYMAAKFAHAFRDLGMTTEAERFARRSLVMSDGYTRGKLFNTALLASTLADQRRIDEACYEASNAVKMATNVRSVRATAYLGDVARRLAPYRSVKVTELYRDMDAIGVATPRV